MEKMALYTHVASLISVALASLFYFAYAFAARRQRSATLALTPATDPPSGRTVTAAASRFWDPSQFATMLSVNGLVFVTLSMILRSIATGHGPFSNMYEFSLAFSWGILAACLFFEWRYRAHALGVLLMPVAAGMLAYAATLSSKASPLVPALQNDLLLSLHVAVAIIAYGTFAVSFGAATLYLVQRKRRISWIPEATTLDDIGFRAVLVGFPFMALVLILGALWADIAWGRYWSWDPKETATLVTWLMYAGYIHARTLGGWKGTRSAILLILGFVAVMFTYFGNYFLGGLHSYGAT